MQFNNTPGPDALTALTGTRHSFYWLDRAERPSTAPELVGADSTDLLVVGAGFTGLWTAYHLLRIDPTLRVMLLEREIAGFGASGRNGGWALGEYSISPMAWVARSTPEGAVRQLRGLYDAIDDIGQKTGRSARAVICPITRKPMRARATK